MDSKSLTLGKDGNGSHLAGNRYGRRQMKVAFDIDAWAAGTSLVIKHVFGPGKMEEGLILSLWESYCYYFPRCT